MIEHLMRQVSEDRLIESLSQMVSIQSVNPFDEPPGPDHREQEFADFFVSQMENLGLETGTREVSPGRPNVWGTLRGTGGGPAIMLAGHMDTVGVPDYPTAFEPRVADGRLHGRGSCDMKAALACYLEVIRVLKDTGVSLKGDLIVAGVADEEHLMIGSKDWGRNGPHADFGIIGEPTELAVCPAHKGQYCLFIRTFGKAVHSSVPHLGENAIERMARIINAFADYNDELAQRPAHPMCGHGTFNVGVITGGSISSAVPDFCQIEVDRRILPGETHEQIVDEYKARIDPLIVDDPGFRYEIVGGSLETPALDVAVDSPVVTALAQAAQAITGAPAEVKALAAATDAPNMGFPSVLCGPGSIAQAHTTNEYVAIDQLTKVTRIYLHTILSMSG